MLRSGTTAHDPLVNASKGVEDLGDSRSLNKLTLHCNGILPSQ